MNRKISMGILSLAACAIFSFLTGCGGSSSSSSGGGGGGNTTPTIAITANSGFITSAVTGGSFGTFSATVTSNGSPASGVSVTFTAPASGASGTFATSPAAATDTETTNSSGVATSQVFTANSTTGAYTVTATTSGAATPANFGLTNTSVTTTSATYTFYLSGLELINGGPNYYAIAGSVTIDSNGNILDGEQDYNDGFGITSAQPSGDTISAANGALTVDSTGQGTLTLTTNNTSVGIAGAETFAIQFVNTNHALITQFDGTATSSGSLDLQTQGQTTPSGPFAFTLSGVDLLYAPVAYGGQFNVSGGTFTNGDVDFNDNGSSVQGSAFSGTFSAPDSFGRGSISGVSVNGNALALNYYIVGPEVLRIIDVDTGFAASGTGNAAVGSAFGQGIGSFANTSLNGNYVFAIAGNPWVFGTAALSQFNLDGNGTVVSGLGDDNEVVNGVEALDMLLPTSTYSLDSTGVGTLSTSNLGDVTSLGIYMTDPNLNLNDPNNSGTGAAVGGALLIDFDSVLAGSTGTVTPQTDNTTASLTGNYAVGWQNFNAFANGSNLNEFDMVGEGTISSTALSLTGLDSDPFGSLTGIAGESQGDTFTGTPLADNPADGRYSMISPNTLNATINGATGPFEFVVYQANGGQLFWLGVDTIDTFPAVVSMGPVEQQGSLTGVPLARKPASKNESKPQSQRKIVRP